MAWYYGEYSCGHKGRVDIVGPIKHRQWKADRHFEKLCPDCYKKHLEEERIRANEEAAKKAKEMELPELQGTEKQVAWANTLRQNLIDEFEGIEEQAYERRARRYEIKAKYAELPIVLHYILMTHNSAKYYIDNRDSDVYSIIKEAAAEALKPEAVKTNEELEKVTEAQIRAEATVYPANRVTDAVVEITAMEDKVEARFERNDDFRKIVKGLGYKWTGKAWEKEIKETTGSYRDRAAELGNKLLNAGFPILILDNEIKQNAIDGVYEPECHRWIYSRSKENTLAIKWAGRDDSLYKKARSLPGSKWEGAVVVKIEHYKEVQEFANLYGFKFTKAAQKSIEEYTNAQELIQTVKPAKIKEEQTKDGLQEILNSGSEIIDDLKD